MSAGGLSDGGDRWCWVVVTCSFVIHVLTLGVSLSLGGLYVAWLHEFQESKAATSWVVSIVVATMTGMGEFIHPA